MDVAKRIQNKEIKILLQVEAPTVPMVNVVLGEVIAEPVGSYY